MPHNTHSVATITKYVTTFLQHKQTLASTIDPVYAELLLEMSHLIGRGGKRLRPRLTVTAFDGYGGDPDDNSIIPVAASQELCHTFLLIHDDIIDRDLIRWGGPNIQGVYQEKFSHMEPNGNAGWTAQSYALVAGDLCMSFAYEMVLTSHAPLAVIQAILNDINMTLFKTLGGEIMDIDIPRQTAISVSRQRLLSMAAHKTAVYSFATPLIVGARLAGVEAPEILKLQTFATPLGTAYQIQDDILGTFGDQARMGKSVLSDIQEGKQTLLSYYVFKHGSTAEKKQLKALLGNSAADEDTLAQVRQIYIATGSLAYTQSVLNRYLEQASAALDTLHIHKSARASLTEIVNFARARDV